MGGSSIWERPLSEPEGRSMLYMDVQSFEWLPCNTRFPMPWLVQKKYCWFLVVIEKSNLLWSAGFPLKIGYLHEKSLLERCYRGRFPRRQQHNVSSASDIVLILNCPQKVSPLLDSFERVILGRSYILCSFYGLLWMEFAFYSIAFSSNWYRK